MKIYPPTRNFKMITATKDTADATGNVSYTGCGFKPKTIIFIFGTTASTSQMSIGAQQDTSSVTLHDNNASSAGTYAIRTDSIGMLVQTGAIYTLVTFVSFDSDGFTLNWAKTGAKTGTAQITAICFG